MYVCYSEMSMAKMIEYGGVGKWSLARGCTSGLREMTIGGEAIIGNGFAEWRSPLIGNLFWLFGGFLRRNRRLNLSGGG